MKVPENLKLERLSFKYLISQTLLILNLERGIGYTIKWFLLNPGKAVQEYLFEDRRRMIKPISFVVLMAAISTYLTLTFIFHGDEMLTQLHADPDWEAVPEQFKPVIDQIVIITQKYFNLSYLTTIPLLSLSTFLVFKESALNFTEHLIINCYLYCMQTIFLVLTIPVLAMVPELGAIIGILIMGYLIYAYSNIFEMKILAGLKKVWLVYLIYTTFSIVLLSILVFILFSKS